MRSRGHGISGRSTNDGGLIIDLRRMDQIEILDEATRRIRVQPGARWMDVAAAIEPYGWALSSGDYGGVGVGGLATAGGVGWLVREHGLTIDHLRKAQIVLADGSIVDASETENPDLFWAIRGAGANMGIVTSFEFEVDPIGEVGWAQLVLDATDIPAFLQAWGSWIENSPRDTTSFMIMGQQRNARQMYAHVLTVIDSPDPETIVSRLQPLADVAQVLQQRHRDHDLCRCDGQCQRPLSPGAGRSGGTLRIAGAHHARVRRGGETLDRRWRLVLLPDSLDGRRGGRCAAGRDGVPEPVGQLFRGCLWAKPSAA